ncbi:MAG TPA: HEAT repeat domain-containing protein, partial [Kofleriaceae bacterium]|nr:HEAT repeat domain-containing protein [Kofleriaceae bacterium]
LDRDGAPEQIRIEREGSLAILSGRTGAVLAWKPLLAGSAVDRGEIQIATGAAVGGRTVILAVARSGEVAAGSGAPGEALAAEWRGAALRELWRGEVGPQGADRESTLYVEAGRLGLIRYSGRAGVARCDGKTAHLYAEKFDFAGGGRFRSVDQTPRIPPDAPELVATRAPPAGVRASAAPLDFRVLAASSQIGASGPGDLAAPSEIEDGDPTTAWVEGRAGFGRGEFVTARASLDGGLVRAIRLVPGHAASARTFAQFNRLKKVGLLVGREHAFRVAFAQDPARAGAAGDAWWIALPEPVAADCVSLVVVDVYPGQGARAGGGYTAIAELSVLTELDLAPGSAAARLAAAVASGGREGDQAARVLVRLGGAAEAALMAEAQRPRAPPDALLRVRRALADLPAGAAELARGLAARSLHPADAERFSRALVAIGRPAVEPLGEVATGRAVPTEGRARAAQVLGGIADPSALRALAAAAGSGPREVRRAVARAMGGRPAGELDALLELARGAAEESEAREADLWRGLGLMLRAQPAGPPRARAVAALSRRMGDARGYELRYRLIEAAGGLDEPELVAALAAQLEAATPGPTATTGPAATRAPAENAATAAIERARGTALRRVAAAAMARGRAPAGTAALVRAARDPDPGVREAAAEALGERGQAAGDAALAAELADSWPRVRRASAVALASACARPQPAAGLRRAALRDVDVEVRRAALSSLATCGAAGAVRFFLAVAGDRAAPVEVRTLALRLIGGSGDRSAARPLAVLVGGELERAFGDERAIAPAAAGVYALGELGDPSAVPVLMRAAEAVSFPEIQAAAAGALARSCPPAALPILRDLAASGQHQVASPARAALRKCGAR